MVKQQPCGYWSILKCVWRMTDPVADWTDAAIGFECHSIDVRRSWRWRERVHHLLWDLRVQATRRRARPNSVERNGGLHPNSFLLPCNNQILVFLRRHYMCYIYIINLDWKKQGQVEGHWMLSFLKLQSWMNPCGCASPNDKPLTTIVGHMSNHQSVQLLI